MLLYVGVDDLARPEHRFKRTRQAPDSTMGKHGPVITVTSYSPVARLRWTRIPSDEDIKKS